MLLYEIDRLMTGPATLSQVILVIGIASYCVVRNLKG